MSLHLDADVMAVGEGDHAGVVLEDGAAEIAFSSLAVALVEGVQDLYPACGIPDEAFIRGKVPMTKKMIRMALSSLLQISPEETVWDIGAGTGSISVELARQAAGGIVYAVECRPAV